MRKKKREIASSSNRHLLASATTRGEEKKRERGEMPPPGCALNCGRKEEEGKGNSSEDTKKGPVDPFLEPRKKKGRKRLCSSPLVRRNGEKGRKRRRIGSWLGSA